MMTTRKTIRKKKIDPLTARGVDPEMPWQVARRTVRDCPGGRTEEEFDNAIVSLERRVFPAAHCKDPEAEID